MCMDVLPTCMPICHIPAAHGTEESIGFPGTRVTHGCELPHGCWESKLDLLEEQ